MRVAGARVLVVDDEAGRADHRARVAAARGFDVTTVNDGAEAVELLRTDTGFRRRAAGHDDAAHERRRGVPADRRSCSPTCPVVLTSGYSEQEAVGRFGGDGIAGFIQKPFMPAALVKMMHDAIGQGLAAGRSHEQ